MEPKLFIQLIIGVSFCYVSFTYGADPTTSSVCNKDVKIRLITEKRECVKGLFETKLNIPDTTPSTRSCTTMQDVVDNYNRTFNFLSVCYTNNVTKRGVQDSMNIRLELIRAVIESNNAAQEFVKSNATQCIQQYGQEVLVMGVLKVLHNSSANATRGSLFRVKPFNSYSTGVHNQERIRNNTRDIIKGNCGDEAVEYMRTVHVIADRLLSNYTLYKETPLKEPATHRNITGIVLGTLAGLAVLLSSIVLFVSYKRGTICSTKSADARPTSVAYHAKDTRQ